MVSLLNPKSFWERGTQVIGANRHAAKGNLIGPSPPANLVGVDEENLRNRAEVFPPNFDSGGGVYGSRQFRCNYPNSFYFTKPAKES